MSSASRAAGAALAVALCGTVVLEHPGADSLQAAGDREHRTDDPRLESFRFRSIGPAAMGGRVDDIAVVESNPFVYYVGFATGGVWKTVNNGTTFTPVFDIYPVASIGDVEVSQKNPDIVWVGTGEANHRQSSSFGDGLYKSTDGGATFQHVGLRETQTIARIVIDPRDDNVVYVAAVGHLFGPNAERGIYKTSDGGKTWSLVNFVDRDTGFTDIAIDPGAPDTLYAASYQRRRVAWGFNGGGPGSAIWKTTDAGKTWTRLTGSGLPTDSTIGRIGLDVSRSKPGVVMALIEVGTYAVFGGNFLDDGREVPPGLASRPRRARSALKPGDDPDPTQSGTWRSEDSGKTWRIISNHNDRPMYYSQIRIDPRNDQVVYTGGAPFHRSIDGGRTFVEIDGLSHSDNHAIWIDPNDTNHLLVGHDGGFDVTYDRGATWEYLNSIPLGQFYGISADMRKPYYVCGGMQDNHAWCGPSSVRSPSGILNEDWFQIASGDSFYSQNDPADWATVYATTPFGATFRVDLKTGQTVNIRPRAAQPPVSIPGLTVLDPDPPNIVPPAPATEQPRFYWSHPVVISPHDPRTLYVGGDRLYISRDRGNTYTRTIDLTSRIDRTSRSVMSVPNNGPMASKSDGIGAYSTITTVSESPVARGVLWVGTDDGNLQVSRDGAATWKNVFGNIPGAPKEIEVSRVEASHFDPATCYATLDGRWMDDMRPYVFVTRDYGETWASIAANLPMGPANVIREGLRNKALLFVGTEYGLFASLDGGTQWSRFMNGLPTVRVDDLLIHPRDFDLIVGTHGRSIWIADDITALESLTQAASAGVQLFSPRPATAWIDDPALQRLRYAGAKRFAGQNPPRGTAIGYFLADPVADPVTITISDAMGRTLRTLSGPGAAGLHRVPWDLLREGSAGQGGGAPARRGSRVEPGTYGVSLSVGSKTLVTTLLVEADSRER